MSEVTNSAVRLTDDSEQTRRRQYRITARLLKEYTARLYRIANHVGEYLDQLITNGSNGIMPYSVAVSVSRYRGTRTEVEALTLFASQMLVHYAIDEAEAAELRVRLKDAERVMALLEIMDERVPPGPWKPRASTESRSLFDQK